MRPSLQVSTCWLMFMPTGVGGVKKWIEKCMLILRFNNYLQRIFVVLKLNAESTNLITNGSNQYTEQEFAKMLDVKGYPTILFYNKQFQLVSRFSGYSEPGEFIRYLKYISGKHYIQYTFQEYLQKVHDD